MNSATQRKAFNKKTRKGKVIRIVQEKYLRHDVECGYLAGNIVSAEVLCDAVSKSAHKQLLVIDTNIALHQIDILEYSCPIISMIVIAQTVLQELRHLNISVYRRIISILKDESRSFIFYPNEISVATTILR
jgi:exosome complex exonuclease DIS3/RRP44